MSELESKPVLAIDAGGTYFKSALLDRSGRILDGSFYQVRSGSESPAEEIITAYVSIIRRAVSRAAKSGTVPAGIGISTPGPFDYKRGISLMKHKFAGLYGVNLIEQLSREVPEVSGIPFRFQHDANAFLAGEAWRGAAHAHGARLGGVTLGTGIGVACCVDGKFINNELGSPAPGVSLWDAPYRNGIVEDYISARALSAAYQRLKPDHNPAGAKEIEDAAKSGDCKAAAVYADFGADLGKVLTPWCKRFTPDMIVFGGQLAKAFSLFAPALIKNLQPGGKCPELVVGKLGTDAALYGVAALFFPHLNR